MELFLLKKINGFSQKISIVDVWQWPKYASDVTLKISKLYSRNFKGPTVFQRTQKQWKTTVKKWCESLKDAKVFKVDK